MKRTITHSTGTYVGQVCPCHYTTIWPDSEYESHIERMRQIQLGEVDPEEDLNWRKRNNDRINRWKKRKENLNSGKKRIDNLGIQE